MKKLALIACCLVVCLFATSAHAVNSIVVESKGFAVDQVACTVGVFVTNDINLNGMVVPLEIRSLNGNAFIDSGTAATASWGLNPANRVNNSALGLAPPQGGQAANITTLRKAVPEAVSNLDCVGIGDDYAWGASAPQWDGHSPDAMLFATVSQGDCSFEDCVLEPGADPAGTANASLRIRFSVNANQGCFVIDTCCINPANHLVYVDENTTEVPAEFTRGEFTIGAGTCEVVVNQPPTAVCQNVQVAANGSCQGTATAEQVNNGSSDPEDGTNVTLTLQPAGPYALGANPVILIVTDTEGLADTCNATITVVDQTAPTISCPGPISVQCSAAIPNAYADAAAFTAAGGSISDNCPNPVFSFVGTTSDGGSCPEVLTRRYAVTDAAGNADTCEQTITIDDTIPPVITDCPNDTTIHLPNGTTSTTVLYSDATITDNCNNVNIAHLPLSNSTFNEGTTQVRLIASDPCGNADTCFFNVTIIEDPPGNTPPTAVCQNVQVGTDGNCQGAVTAAQVNNGSSDNETAPGNLVLTLEPAGPYALGPTNVSLIVTDEGGLADTCPAVITVVDDDNPSISCPGPISAECDNVPAPYDSAGFLSAGGSFSDNCGNVDWSYMGEVSDNLTCPETITRTYRVMDGAGNFVECTQSITVDDTTPPSVTCDGDTVVIIAPGTGTVAVVYGPASATDNCDGNPTVACTPPSGSMFGIGVNVVTCIATDECGNADTCTFTITVQEEVLNAPPEALCSDREVSADANCEANADINNGSFDPDGGGAVTLSQSPAGPYPLGVTLVLLTVTDDEGDTDTCSANVTVRDFTPPTANCPQVDVQADNAPGQCGAIVEFAYDASDNCPGVTVAAFPESGSFFNVGVNPVMVIATDGSGNADTCNFNVIVNDVEPPVASCPSPITVSNDPGQCGAIVSWGNDISAPDNCPGTISTYTPPSGAFFPVGTTEVKHVLEDASGNRDSCFFNVTVNDTEDPVATCPLEVIVQAPFGQNGAVVNFESSASDNCPGVTHECDSASGSFFLVGQYEICCYATDAAGNVDTCCFPVTVLPPGQEVPGPHVAEETDTVMFKVTCGCDSQQVNLFCVETTSPEGGGCFYQAESTVPGITVNPNPGTAPNSPWIVACVGTLPPDTYDGWVYFHNATGAISDSLWVIFEVNPAIGGISVSPDTLKFTYTGDLFNDELCLPVEITSNGCTETCWSYQGDGGDWVWVDPTSGSTPGTPEVCVTPCSLQAGVYYDTLTFCECDVKGVQPCDQVIVQLTVVDPPVLVVEPLNLLFEIQCDQKTLPLPVYIINGGGGVLDWNAFEEANWFDVDPTSGTAPDSFYVSLLYDSIPCPEVCDTLIDSICVFGNKSCALNSPQWVRVELRICPPPDTVECDSICGEVFDASCFSKTTCHINDATVELWTSYPDGVLITSTTTVDGAFCFAVEPGVEYEIRVWKKGYCTDVVGPWSCEDGHLVITLDPINFVPLPNWPYFTDYYSSDATSEGYPIQPGDVIYATDPDGVICGITYVEADSAGTYLIHVLGDDPKTAEDEGAEPGDSITLWLNCECPVVAPDTWVNFGSFLFDAAWDCRPTGICCELCEGWNMWSYNIILPDYAREAVLATIDLNYDAVRSGLCDYGSISWFADRPINDLVDVTPWYGYDIHMTAADTVCIEGEVIDPSTPIYLCEGWNYIPYLPMEADNLGHALESLSGNYAHIFTMYCGYGVASWNELRDPQNNDLVCMESCHGYWIKMKSDDTLIYPANPEGCVVSAKLVANSTSGRVVTSPMVADYYAGSSSLNAGSVISVRTSTGTVIGEGTVGANGAFLVHVYGDVPQTSVIEGAIYGEELTFEVNGLAASAGSSILWQDRDNREISLTVDQAAAVPTEYALLQNYPNPFNAGTVMPFTMKDASQWSLTVYNIMGQTVRTFDGFDAAGTVRVSWDGRDDNGSAVPSGVYFYRVTTANWSATKKMTLLK